MEVKSPTVCIVFDLYSVYASPFPLTHQIKTTDLLEKSRVVFQQRGERNFHVFYQFTKAASAQEKQQFGINGPEDFYYLTQGECMSVDTIDDHQEWADMRNAMNVIGMTGTEQNSIFRLLAAILWLGNIDFTETGDKASVADDSSTYSLAHHELSYPVLNTQNNSPRFRR